MSADGETPRVVSYGNLSRLLIIATPEHGTCFEIDPLPIYVGMTPSDVVDALHEMAWSQPLTFDVSFV